MGMGVKGVRGEGKEEEGRSGKEKGKGRKRRKE